MRVALFVTCVNDTLFPGTGRATVRLLERLGCRVEFPEAQTCCGQMHFNTGYREDAMPLALRVGEVFSGYDAVVMPSGSCAAMVREWYPALGVEVPSGVYELSEFLVDVLKVKDVGAYFPHTVTYHPTCHSLRSLRVGDRPHSLLSAVRGLTLLPLGGADECCGFGGTFSLKNPAVSAAMCTDKVRNVLDTGAEVLCATDNSCLMHIGGTMRRERAGVRMMHLAQILASTEEDPA
ncbi:(Fe-S)-binding protein [Actinomadura logoneensis]|uniref:(Fe-S)-binding protein n=1 Tax=Actinomadura logoneensis TaxID=2293572 RepID=A0A372JSE1_9ACTN|nr:(Fe-S)-binding protein [Actinomadura logoneensis]RFU42953.1 (Fe-S)-binding protein [Actinomadura logoneensis]